MHPLVQMRDVWTVEDLDTLDVEDWHRYEIVDGALVVSPSPEVRHEFVIYHLQMALLPCTPPQLAVLAGNLGIEIGRSYRVPDLLVVPDALRLRADERLQPADVLLVVEVVSPGSVTMDRVMKPAQYAAAGIPSFWRVETDPVSLTAYELPAGANTYAEVGTWGAGETARLTAPFAVEIDLDRLV